MSGRPWLRVALLALAPAATADTLPVWSAQWGSPQKAAAAFGVLFGADRGEGFDLNVRGLLIEARPGIGGGALNLGWVPLSASVAGSQFAGAALKATLLRTWGSPAGLEPQRTYAGAELHAAWVVKLSVGVLWRVGRRPPGAGGAAFTWAVGYGL